METRLLQLGPDLDRLFFATYCRAVSSLETAGRPSEEGAELTTKGVGRDSGIHRVRKYCQVLLSERGVSEASRIIPVHIPRESHN